ncbi:hypothetical protein BC567DRAFT_235448 [Phyllosticta citribraziliensis]
MIGTLGRSDAGGRFLVGWGFLSGVCWGSCPLAHGLLDSGSSCFLALFGRCFVIRGYFSLLFLAVAVFRSLGCCFVSIAPQRRMVMKVVCEQLDEYFT